MHIPIQVVSRSTRRLRYTKTFAESADEMTVGWSPARPEGRWSWREGESGSHLTLSRAPAKRPNADQGICHSFPSLHRTESTLFHSFELLSRRISSHTRDRPPTFRCHPWYRYRCRTRTDITRSPQEVISARPYPGDCTCWALRTFNTCVTVVNRTDGRTSEKVKRERVPLLDRDASWREIAGALSAR